MTHRTWFWLIVIALPLAVLGVLVATSYRYGSLVVLPEPKTATVLVDGKETGFSSRLKPGAYQITITASGFVPERQTVTIRALRISRLRPELKPLASPKIVVAEEVDLLKADRGSDQFFYFNRQARALFRLRFVKGKIENIPITPSVLGNLAEVAYAPDYSVALLRDRDTSSGLYNFARYDLLHQEFKPYDKDSRAFVFDPKGSLIYHLYSPGTERSLVRAERSRERIERLVNLKDIPLENAELSISPSGDTVLITGSGTAHLVVVTTKKITKVAEGVSSAAFLDDRRLLLSRNSELEAIPFEVVTEGSRDEVGTIKPGQPTKLGARAEVAELAIAPERLVGIFGKDFGSFELKTQRFLPLKLAIDLPEGAHNFAIDAANRNVLFIAQAKLWWLEL